MNPPSSDGANALLAPADLHSNAHFLRAVLQMADKQKVVAKVPIYSASGTKLLDRGMQLDSSLFQLLSQHRLSYAIDDQVAITGGIDVVSLQSRVHLLSGSTQMGRLLGQLMGDKHYMLLEALRYMQWPARASFKLTLMRYQLPELLEHSILMMMVAVWLAVEEQMSMEDCAELAAAALLHDAGMLYLPSKWSNSSYRLDTEERRQLASHAMISTLVVRSTHAYSTRAEDAVFQHHERLDGSGYPCHLKGEEITHWSRILMLSEVVSAFFSNFNDIPGQRLSLMLRMNHNRFDVRMMQHVFKLVALEAQTPSHAVNTSVLEVRTIIATLGGIFHSWNKCKSSFPADWQKSSGRAATVYMDARMAAIERSLAESGSHPRQQANWLRIFEENPSSMVELVMVNKEAIWQIEASIATCIRRWPQLLQPSCALEAVMHDWLLSCRTVLGDKQAPVSFTAT